MYTILLHYRTTQWHGCARHGARRKSLSRWRQDVRQRQTSIDMLFMKQRMSSYMHVQNQMNSLWDIRIFLGLVPKESHCITRNGLLRFAAHKHESISVLRPGNDTVNTIILACDAVYSSTYASTFHCNLFSPSALMISWTVSSEISVHMYQTSRSHNITATFSEKFSDSKCVVLEKREILFTQWELNFAIVQPIA